MSKVFRD